MLYEGPNVKEVLLFHLSSILEHTVYEAEAVGLIMGMHLLTKYQCQFCSKILLRRDSQAVLCVLKNQLTHPGQYLLDHIHNAAEGLQEKQDGLLNAVEKWSARRHGEEWKGRKRGVFDLQLFWVPGHKGFAPNEQANKEAKKAAKSQSSKMGSLPVCLWQKGLPASISTLCQENRAALTRHWTQCWKDSPQYCRHHVINSTMPLKKFIWLISSLNRHQSSIITQLQTNHLPLNCYLFCIK